MAEPEKTMGVEEDLLRRCARGDASAYRELVERLEKPLVNFIYRFVGERDAAEDLFQETFVRVVRRVGEFDPRASLTTWIFTIARNLALDHLKARRRHREVALDSAASEDRGKVIYFKDMIRSGVPDPGDLAEASEEERRVARALAALRPAKREALVMRLYAGLSYAEIAAVVRAPVGTVKFRVHEAIQDLARELGAAGRSSAAQGG